MHIELFPLGMRFSASTGVQTDGVLARTGHLQDGNLIYITAEIITGELADLQFRRPVDPETGYDELEVGTHG